jgi:hypothetical protein
MRRECCVDLKEVRPEGAALLRVVDAGPRARGAVLLLRGAVPEPVEGFENFRHRFGGGRKLSGLEKRREAF